MKVNLDYYFHSLDGKKILKKEQGSKFTDKPPAEVEYMQLRDALETALLTIEPGEKITGEEKVRRHNLAVKIHNTVGEIELGLDNLKLLKDLVGVRFPPLIVAQSWQILDPQGGHNVK